MTTTIFNTECGCCEQAGRDPACRVEYHGIEFYNAVCGCPIRLGIRMEEHEEFVRRIKAAQSILPPSLDEMRAEVERTLEECADAE